MECAMISVLGMEKKLTLWLSWTLCDNCETSQEGISMELYLFILPFSKFDHIIVRSQQCQTVLTENIHVHIQQLMLKLRTIINYRE